MPNTLLKNPVQINAVSTAASLSVSGTPAAATSGTGAQPANTLAVEGTTGQETTGTGETAGAGAHISILAGTGGAAPAGSTTGAGGSITINPGQPGSGAGTPGASGHVLIATTGGNVGIGNSTPTNRLDVNGDVRVNSLGVNIAPGEDGTFSLGGVGTPAVYLNSTSASSDVYLQNSEGRLDMLAHDGTTVNMSVTNAGRVGIGTTTPSTSLEVSGGTRLNAVGVNMTPGGAGSFGIGGTTNPNVRFNSTTASSDVYLQNSAGRFDVLANDGTTARLSVTSAGDVGIGTSSPGARLEIAGGGRAHAFGVNMDPGFTGTLGLGGVQNPSVRFNSTTASSDVYLQNSAGRLDVLANDATTANVSVTNAGSVGIGTTAPSALLHIAGASSNVLARINNNDSTLYDPGNLLRGGRTLRISNTNTTGDYASIEFLTSANGGSAFAAIGAVDTGSVSCAIVFGTRASAGNVAERVRINPSGLVGIGTAAPGSKLHVNGGVQVGAPTGGDKGTGSINISGDIFKNGISQLKRIDALLKRVVRLEAQLARKNAKSGGRAAPKKRTATNLRSKSRKEKR